MSTETASITVLLVDDEENILRSLKRLLMDEEFEVQTASSGEAALELLPTLTNVGLIISDQRMPGMNGAEFLGRSREIAPHALRILLTGYSDANATVEAINKGGASRYISKPWDDDELLEIVRSTVQQYRDEEEKRHLNGIIEQQNKELEQWNDNLKKRLLQTAATIREQSQALKTVDEKSPVGLIAATFDNFLEVMGDRLAMHARTVSTLVTDVARKMGMDGEAMATLRLGALLHDAGKFGTLSATLHKHLDEMSDSEASDYRQHPLRGEAMFGRVDDLAPVIPLIRGHHEAYDGSGFPDRLKGDQIPLGARLIAIADFIEKSARSVNQHRAEYALMSARFHSGTLFDPQLLPKFQGITRIVYFEGKKAGGLSEVEVTPAALTPGMVIARDVESGNGVLLMPRGSVLDSAGVSLIRSHYRKSPPDHGIFVQVSDV